MVVPTYNPTPRKQRQEDGCKFETSLFYIVSLDLKEKGMAPMPLRSLWPLPLKFLSGP